MGSNLIELNTVGLDEGAATFAEAGSEQDALAEYLAVFHETEADAFAEEEVEESEDTRIQILIFRNDSVFIDNSTTGLGGADRGAELIIYPNPAHNNVFVQFESAQIENVLIFDLRGQLVLSNRLNGVNNATVNVEEIPGGVYVMQVATSNGTHTMRLIKQ